MSSKSSILTASPMFFAIFESVMLANGLSAPQHSTYFVILDDGRLRSSGPGVATIGDRRQSMFVIDIFRMSPKIELVDFRRSANAIRPGKWELGKKQGRFKFC